MHLEENLETNQQEKKPFVSTRIKNAPPDLFDPNVPRLGRRESEPHSEEITYIHDVLTTNFPNSRTTWDLHHYFKSEKLEGLIDIQFDISFFLNWEYPRTLSSYKSHLHDNRIPDLAINVLSKSTWRADMLDHVVYCEKLKIPVYIIFAPYHVTSSVFKPPFMRIHVLGDDGKYTHVDVKEIALIEGEQIINKKHVFDVHARLPFRFAIMERKKIHNDGQKLYRLIFLDKTKDEILKTLSERKDELLKREKARAEQEKARAEQEKARAEQEKARAEREKGRADQEKARAEQEKARAEREKARADRLEKMLEELRKKLKDI
ncbi:MAG: hypothetical protein ACTSXP_19770 [Promethearchaeota archaeon]